MPQQVLVVDDTEPILKLTQEIFELSGFNVLTATDGKIALDILAEKRIDLVVTDILMPNIDGYLLCYSIRTNEKLKSLPVIIYSATYTSSSDETMALEIGADMFIRKPAKMEQLISAAQHLLAGSLGSIHKIPEKPKSLEASRLYNEGLVQKLEKRNLELERAAEKLEVSKSRLKKALVIANLGSWEIDLTNNTSNWSEELFTLFGMNKEENQPSSELFMSIVHPDDFDRINNYVAKILENFTDTSFEFRFMRRDGTIRCGFSSYRFEFDKNQKPLRLFGIVQDITDRIKTVNDLKKRNKDLEQFAYIVSHNLRAPIANILGAIQALNNPATIQEEKTILTEALHDEALRLDGVVKDLNQILQIKADKNSKAKVNLTELIKDVLSALRSQINAKEIEIKYDFSAIETVQTLKSYLYSIFHNLISNSIKYRQPDVRLIIELRSYVIPNKVGLIVKDNGLGVDLQKKGDQVFGLYKRFHAHIEGKGMGLFMVKTQVEALGGSINIFSEINKGTEFKIEFEK